jgi:hypothetical protein
LINEQEAENEKTKLKKLEEEKLKQEKEGENQKDKELETSQNESLTPESFEDESKEKQPREGLMSKVKGLFSGIDKEDTKKNALPEKKDDSELENIEQQQPEQIEPHKEDSNDSETILAENQHLVNYKNKEIEKEKIEEEAKSGKNEPENLEPKEKPKVDSKAKNIFDKF